MFFFFRNRLRLQPSATTGPDPKSPKSSFKADNPIRRSEDDVLGREKVAQSFVERVLSLDVSEGVVVGVLGQWGSGKTSFLNLARVYFDAMGVPVLEFNPWMFSGAEQLADMFFVEISAQLKLRSGLSKVGETLEEYGAAFSGLVSLPVIGTWVEGGGKLAQFIGKVFQSKNGGVAGRRTRVQKALTTLNKPLIVVLDDVDRLTNTEIREIFKLVRLTANFPNVVYVVSFDRARVEQALTEQNIPGRDYLEKILQVTLDIPAISTRVLDKEIFAALNVSLATVSNLVPIDENAWPDIFFEVVRPLFRTMRDVRRYSSSAVGAVADLNGQVALVDIMALEAVRIFLPDVYNRLHKSLDALTGTADSPSRAHEDLSSGKEQIAALMECAGDRADVVRALINRLFPPGRRHLSGPRFGSEWKSKWLREQRVAHEDVFRLYLERRVNEGLQAFREAERAWACMADPAALDACLRTAAPDLLPEIISSLREHGRQFGPEHVVPVSVVLLNLVADIPDRDMGLFNFQSTFLVRGFVLNLLTSCTPQVEVSVRQILPQVRLLSAKLALIETVGPNDNGVQPLLPESVTDELFYEWRHNVRAASLEVLEREPEILRVLLHVKRGTTSAEPTLTVLDSPGMTRALLKSARSEARGQAYGSRAIKRLTQLRWEALVEVYGGEATLRERLEQLKAAQPDWDDELLPLAEKYLAGWRPRE